MELQPLPSTPTLTLTITPLPLPARALSRPIKTRGSLGQSKRAFSRPIKNERSAYEAKPRKKWRVVHYHSRACGGSRRSPPPRPASSLCRCCCRVERSGGRSRSNSGPDLIARSMFPFTSILPVINARWGVSFPAHIRKTPRPTTLALSQPDRWPTEQRG